MLYPQQNTFRQTCNLSGFWDFHFATDNDCWPEGFSGGKPIAVPGSWNEMFAEGRDNLGPAWYQTRFDRPWGWENERVFVRFGSVNYLAEVWLNGVRLGAHEGGHLPFTFDITDRIHPENNLLVVRVDGRLDRNHVPPGVIGLEAQDHFGNLQNPPTSFDFFPFTGIHRPVLLYTTPRTAIEDITVVTEIDGATGVVRVQVATRGDVDRLHVTLRGHGVALVGEAEAIKGEVVLEVPDAALWAIGAPNLYDVTVTLAQDGAVQDSYTLPIGIRTIAVDGDRLLLNGESIYLTGFGRHEDFAVVGRGYLPSVIIKDYELLQWIGANSFRTTHYPYSEQMMQLADRLGFLIINETPAVGLHFQQEGLEQRLALCRQQITELIMRDKNHPSVIMWSLANEPHSYRPGHHEFFRELYDLAKALDPTRPVTLVSLVGEGETAFEFLDVVCVNRYRGWYDLPGELDLGVTALSEELDAIHTRYPKPLIMTEFGADTWAGMHSQPPEMFTEEYQAEMLEKYIAVLRSKPYVVGEHVWNMCDFKTGQSVRRFGGLNLKGVFTRDRRPKLAAHRLRALWTSNADGD